MAEHDTSTDDGPVFRLIYRSRLSIPTEDTQGEVARILETARTKNPGLGITGALVVWDEAVVQTLEGDETVVRDLYETISRDPRHEQVEIVDTSPGVERAFARWSMAQVSDDEQSDLPLDVKQWEGGVDVNPRRITTPEEDRAIATMRDRVRGAPA